MPKSQTEPVESFKSLLRKLMRGYEFDVLGLWMADGTRRPLPKESSVVGKVLELSVKEYLFTKLMQVPQLHFVDGGERSYPDLTFHGAALGERRFAVDVKCARRSKNRTQTESRIAIATYDADYFRHPDLKAPNIVAPYSSYASHLALLALYDYDGATARNVEMVVAEKWRIATKQRASGTRYYVAACGLIEDLKAERGEFESETEYEAFWRAQPIKEKKPKPWNTPQLAADQIAEVSPVR